MEAVKQIACPAVACGTVLSNASQEVGSGGLAAGSCQKQDQKNVAECRRSLISNCVAADQSSIAASSNRRGPDAQYAGPGMLFCKLSCRRAMNSGDHVARPEEARAF